jgi:alkylhydroperoxidase family enzyme
LARIRLLPDEELDGATRAAVEAMEASGQDTSTMRGLANAQAMFNSYFQFYGPAREGRSIPAELIELVRLRIARHNDCFT